MVYDSHGKLEIFIFHVFVKYCTENKLILDYAPVYPYEAVNIMAIKLQV